MSYEQDKNEPKSKSQIKREMIALQELGERLTLLNQETLKRLGLPASLIAAIVEYKKITSRNAKHRQLQYIGRLMRELEDSNAIQKALLELEMKDNRANAIYHMLEAWREKLIRDDEEVTEFIKNYPDLDRQHLRQLIKNARNERDFGKPAGACKHLFRYLREIQNNFK
jgi:ribosome-associated protein